MDKSLVFFDIDGTLFHRIDREKRFVKEDLDALRRLKAEGHELFINTGRSRALVPSELLEAVDFDGFVCGSTYIEYHGEVIHREAWDDDVIRRLCYHAEENGWRVGLECEKEVYGIHGGAFHPAINMSGNLDEYMKEPSKLLLTKLTIACEVSPEVQSMFPEINFIDVKTYTEGVTKGYDKSFAMKLLSKKLNIPRERLVAFGDSPNDYEMLKYAGISVIVNSGPAEYDEFVTLRTEKTVGGVAEGIEKIFFSRVD